MYIFWLIIGVALAAVGGDRFVRGVVEMSAVLRIPPGIVGATIAAFATSSPEMVVAVLAATDGAPELALGDALGSNMANLGLVLGVTVSLAKVTARWADIRRDLPAALFTLGLLALLVIDGEVNRVDAVVMFAVFASWLTWVTVDARREVSAVEVLEDEGPRHFIRDVVTGIVALVAAGRLIVSAAESIGDTLGWDKFIVGTVFVAIGTSTPELTTAIVSARRGHAEVGVGAVLGSNVFNTLFIVGIGAIIQPIDVSQPSTYVAIACGAMATVLAMPRRSGDLVFARGLLLLIAYVAYVTVVISTRA